MARIDGCVRRLEQAAGRALTDKEVDGIFKRIHKAALDIKSGKVDVQDVGVGKALGKVVGATDENNVLIQRAADYAANELKREAARQERQAYLQAVKLGGRMKDADDLFADGAKPLEAVQKMIARDYGGHYNIESIEQRQQAYRDYFNSRLLSTWDALGNDFLGFVQDRAKLIDLIKELRGEDSGNALAKKGAKAFHEVAEEARLVFNEHGGDIGRLDDWGHPQHHSQEKVAGAAQSADPDTNRAQWVSDILPMLDRARYVDEFTGQPKTDTEMAEFLGHAWNTISTNGHVNTKPGQYQGGKLANRHAEHRQIHFKDAESTIAYWEKYGEQTAVEILTNHIDTMARDIAFIEKFGPNPDMTYQTLRDAALAKATIADPRQTVPLEGAAVNLDNLYNYASGQSKPTYRRWLRNTADAISNLNVAAKLGGAAIASFFGDKPMMEAVSHMNNIPAVQRWRNEISLLNPLNAADRRALQMQGLMVDSVRSGLQRFYEGLGQSSRTGRLANAVMRVTGMTAINDIRKGSFGLSMYAAIGQQLTAGVDFGKLDASDVRALTTFGVTKPEWDTWRLAKLERMAGVDDIITPEAISRITDDDLRAAHVIGQADGPEVAAAARRNAILKLTGLVNTEAEFAIVTPGWTERAAFYGAQQRGTVPGEIMRATLQFKSFPFAYLMRSFDAIANQDGPVSKAVMVSWLLFAGTLAGAMIMQVRDTLAGKDPRKMWQDGDYNKVKFLGASFLQGGALGIYGDFLYGANQTRYGSGILEAISGPTLGPLLELGLVHPMDAIRKTMEGKETHLAARTLQSLKGFVPGSNIWYTRAALDHLVWQRAMEALSPGYLTTVRQRALKDYGQDWWWQPGEASPDRAPDFAGAFAR
jgi:hypothetical protein